MATEKEGWFDMKKNCLTSSRRLIVEIRPSYERYIDEDDVFNYTKILWNAIIY